MEGNIKVKLQTNGTSDQWNSTVTIHPLKMPGFIQVLGFAKRRAKQLKPEKIRMMSFPINQRNCLLKLYWKF